MSARSPLPAWLEVLVPVLVSAALFGMVLFILLYPATTVSYGPIDREDWLAASDDALTDVRTARREIASKLLYQKLLLGKSRAEVLEWLGEPMLRKPATSDSPEEWTWPISRDRMGSKDLYVLIASFHPAVDAVQGTMTDVRPQP